MKPEDYAKALGAQQAIKQAEEEGGLPWWAPLAAAGGLGLGAYALARRPSLADPKQWPILRKIQDMARGKMYRADVRGAPMEAPRGLEKVKRQVMHGPEAFEEGLPRAAMGTKKKPTAVWSGQQEPIKGTFDPSLGPHTGESAMAEWMHQYVQHMGDKLEQARLLAKEAPGTMARTLSVADIAKKYGIKVRPGKNLDRDLRKLQEALKKEFDGEYLIKPRGAREGGDIAAASSGVFPTGKTDLPQAYKQWKKMRPEYRREMEELENAIGDTDVNRIIEAFRTRPGFEGRLVDELLHGNVVFQQKLPLKQYGARTAKKLKEKGLVTNPEYRVHAIGGKVIPALAMPRSYTNPIRSLVETIKARRAARWAQKNVIDKLQGSAKEIGYGMDIAPLKGGGYKVIELNPGGASGLLETPVIGSQMLHKAVTGRHTKPMAALLGLGSAGVGAGGTALTSAALGNAPTDADPSAVA